MVHPYPVQGGRRPPDSHLFPYATSTNGWSSSGGGYAGSGQDVTHAKSSRVLEGTTHPVNTP